MRSISVAVIGICLLIGSTPSAEGGLFKRLRQRHAASAPAKMNPAQCVVHQEYLLNVQCIQCKFPLTCDPRRIAAMNAARQIYCLGLQQACINPCSYVDSVRGFSCFRSIYLPCIENAKTPEDFYCACVEYNKCLANNSTGEIEMACSILLK